MRSSYLPYATLALLALLAAFGLVRDIQNTHKGGAIDLRNRVTGTRVAQEGRDPFSYKWDMSEPEEFCDPFNMKTWPLSKTTVTPVALALHAPFSGFKYKTIQWLWFLVQYGALSLGCLAWAQGRSRSIIFWGTAWTLTFCLTAAWRLHVDRGQIYVLYAGLLLVLVWLGEGKQKWNALLEGGLGAVLMGVRPIFIGQFAPPLVQRRWLSTGAAIAALVAVLVAPMLLFGGSTWTQYKSAMEEHGRLYLEQVLLKSAPTAFPATVEDIPFDDLAHFARIPFADSSIHKLMSFSLGTTASKMLLITWALLMLGAGGYMMRRAPEAGNLLWWAVSAWALLGDYLLPAYRNIYNDILLWPLLLMGLVVLKDKAQSVWIGLSSLILVAHLAVWMMPKWFIPMPSFLGAMLALGVVVWSLILTRRLDATGSLAKS